MEIKGFIENSLVDYDGKISCVLFLPGCNFRCGFCFNHLLIFEPEKLETVSFERIESFLNAKKDFVDAVVITGGEPSLNPQLPELCRKIKELGFLVKIDTNGSFPEVIEKLINEKLVDFVAMDVKGLLEDYKEVTNSNVDVDKIKKSINLLMKNKVGYEFRITTVPRFITDETVEKIGKMLDGAEKIALQKFRPDNAMDEEFRKMKTYTLEDLQRFADILKKYIKDIRIRGA